MRELLEQVLAIAKAADDAIMAVYGRAFDVTVKQDNSPLTEADRAAHNVIRHGLQALTPTYPILSEEDVEGFSGVGDDGRYWLVDPLDGTKEFIKRNGEFTVNIALIEHGAPVLGVVTAPVTGSTVIDPWSGPATTATEAGSMRRWPPGVVKARIFGIFTTSSLSRLNFENTASMPCCCA